MISIIIPTLNEERFIQRLLESIKKQSFKKFEVVVVDSSDNNKTINIVKKYSKFFKLKIIKSNKNTSFQRNIGAKKSLYDLLVFVDADSILKKNVIKNIVKEVKYKKISSGAAYTYALSNKILYKLYYFIFRIYTTIFYRLDGVNGGLIFCEKSIHNKVGGFDESIVLAEDYEYTKKLIRNSKFKLMNNLVVKTSIRRFDHEGKLVLPIKLIAAGLYRILFGDIKNDIFRYKFGMFNK